MKKVYNFSLATSQHNVPSFRRRWAKDIKSDDYCIVIQGHIIDHVDDMLEFLNLPHIQHLVKRLGHPILQSLHTGNASITSLQFAKQNTHWFRPHPSREDHLDVTHVNNGQVHRFGKTEVRQACTNKVAMLMDCFGCDHNPAKDGGKSSCTYAVEEAWCKERGLYDACNLDAVPENEVDLYEWRKLLESIKHPRFHYVPAHLAHGQTREFQASEQFYGVYQFPDEQGERDELSARAETAAQSRKAKKLAKKNCTLWGSCYWTKGRTHKSYMGRTCARCQTEGQYYLANVKGIFVDEHWKAGLEEWKARHPDVNWDDVWFFSKVVPSNFTTRLVPGLCGRKAWLRSMDKNLQRVIFSTKTGDAVSLSVEDAKVLIQVGPTTRYGRIAGRSAFENGFYTSKLNDVEQALYIEACQRKTIKLDVFRPIFYPNGGRGSHAFSVIGSHREERSYPLGAVRFYHSKLEVEYINSKGFQRLEWLEPADIIRDLKKSTWFSLSHLPEDVFDIIREKAVAAAEEKELQTREVSRIERRRQFLARQQMLPIDLAAGQESR